MKYRVIPTNIFKKDYKLAIKRGKKINKLHDIVELLANDLELPATSATTILRGTGNIIESYT